MLKIAFEDIPFHSFKKRLRSGQLTAPELNDQNRQLFGLPSHIAQREAYAADRESITDSFQGEAIRFVETPTWHVRGKGRKG